MAKVSLGLVGIADKGEYDSTISYNKGQFVYYLGSTYLCLLDNTTVPPSNDKKNWKYLARGTEEVDGLRLQDDSDGKIYKVGINSGGLYIEESIGNIDTPIFTDTATNKKYTMGIENTLIYISEIT